MRRLVLPVAGLAGLALAVVPALAADQTVTTSGNDFVPDEVGMQVGDTVTIHNGGGGLHDLNWADGGDPGQPIENTSDWSEQRTFSANGEYVFFCDVHGSATSGMRGTVYVNDAGTVPSGDGGGGGGGGGGTTTTSTTPPPGGTTTETTPAPPPPGGTTTSTTGTPPPSGDSTPPSVSNARARATRRGVRIVMSVGEPARVTVRVLRRGRRVARRTFTVRQSGLVVLRIRRALRRGRYGIRLTLVDAAGNAATRRLSARVR